MFDFTCNAMTKVISDPTTKSGMAANYIVHTKIVNHLLFSSIIYKLIIWPWAAILDFTHKKMYKVI